MDDKSEAAFRRGYQHGYDAALTDMQHGASLETMNDFFNEVLMPWRDARPMIADVPPVLLREKPYSNGESQ